jgi:hypothetical protein
MKADKSILPLPAVNPFLPEFGGNGGYRLKILARIKTSYRVDILFPQYSTSSLNKQA